MAAPVDNKIDLAFGWQGSSSMQTEWGWLTLKAVQLLFEGAKTMYHVKIPTKNFDTSVIHPLSFVSKKEGFAETFPEHLRITVEQVQKLRLQISVEEGRDTVRVRTTDLPFFIPANLVFGQTYRLVVSSQNATWQATLIEEKMAPVNKPVEEQMLEDRHTLFRILRQNIIKFPFEPQVALDAAQQEIAKVELGPLAVAMKKARELNECKKGKSIAESIALQDEITRLGLDLIGPERFARIMNVAVQYALRGQPELKDQYEQLSMELQKLCFSRSQLFQPEDKVSLFFCWNGSSSASDRIVKTVDFFYQDAKERVVVPIPPICLDSLTAFWCGDGNTPLVKLSLTTHQIQSLKLKISTLGPNVHQEEDLKVEIPQELKGGQSYCIRGSLEGATLVELPLFFNRNKIVQLMHGLMIGIFKKSANIEASDLNQARLYHFIHKELLTIADEKIEETVSVIEELGASVDFKTKEETFAKKVIPFYLNRIGKERFFNILYTSVHYILYQGKALSPAEKLAIHEIAKKLSVSISSF